MARTAPQDKPDTQDTAPDVPARDSFTSDDPVGKAFTIAYQVQDEYEALKKKRAANRRILRDMRDSDMLNPAQAAEVTRLYDKGKTDADKA